MNTLDIGACFTTKFDDSPLRYRKILSYHDGDGRLYYRLEAFIAGGEKKKTYKITLDSEDINSQIKDGIAKIISPQKYEIEKTLRLL